MKKILLSLVLLTTLTGCGNDTSSEVESSSQTEETVEATSGNYEENMTGGTEVAPLAENDLVITDTDGDNILDATKDETEDILDNTGFEYTVKVFDTDGDGAVSDEDDTNEQFTTVINLKNVSGNDIEMSDLQFYLQSSDEDEPIEMTYIDTGDMDTDKFILGEEHYENYIRYVDEETYDQFTFPKDNEITIVLTSTVSVAIDDIEPAELSFVALNSDGVSYYVESTTQFTAK